MIAKSPTHASVDESNRALDTRKKNHSKISRKNLKKNQKKIEKKIFENDQLLKVLHQTNVINFAIIDFCVKLLTVESLFILEVILTFSTQ